MALDILLLLSIYTYFLLSSYQSILQNLCRRKGAVKDVYNE
jgi:hypothetical protein